MRRQQRIDRPRGARAYLLLVLTVLAGVAAMHGLGPVPAGPSASRPMHHGAPVAAEAPGDHACGERADREDDTSGGHAEHADRTCAATGISTAPAPFLASSAAFGPSALLPQRVLAEGQPGGRAPPSLSELQLLRI